jgi:hypothetical protein
MIRIEDIVEFNNKFGTYAANDGARAIVTDFNEDYLSVKWIRNGEDNGQEDGEYFYNLFKKVEEVSTQKEDRILIENKKVMKEKNLFNAVKTFINGIPVGNLFTTGFLIDMVGDDEVLTRWKDSNSNPFYRTHTYKTYLKRTGFLSKVKQGVWRVEKHIPESYNLGTIEFLIGYKGKTYNGMTREEILRDEILNDTIQVGDTVELINEKGKYAAADGARAIVTDWHKNDLISVKWIRNGEDNGQNDGEYFYNLFKKVEEVSTQKEDRILIENEKDMKFDFEKGKILLMEYFQSDLERGEIYTLQIIKESNDLGDIEMEIDVFNHFKNGIERTITKINQSKTLSDIFKVLIDTDLEDDDETVLSFFIEGL